MIIIRIASKKDLLLAAKAYFLAFRSNSASEHWTLKKAKNFLSKCAVRQPDLFLLAKHGSTVVGGVFADIKPWWDGNHLTNPELFVIPAYRGKGVGRHLLESILEKALSKYRIVAIEATTFCGNTFPVDWYKRLGFRVPQNVTIICGNARVIIRRLRTKHSHQCIKTSFSGRYCIDRKFSRVLNLGRCRSGSSSS